MNKEYLLKYLQINRGRKITFDADEVPFLKPVAEYSDLGESISVAEKFRANWPAIVFSKACMVDGAVLIQDIAPDATLTRAVKKLNETSNITLQVVDGLSLTENMATLIEESGVLNTNPFIIYPGNGAQLVKSFIVSLDKKFNDNAIDLPTKRTMIRKGKFKLDVDYSSLPQEIDTGTVLIIDDVVASGQTAQIIASEIKTRFPNVRCVLAIWLFMAPTELENKKSPSGIMGVDQALTSIALKGNLTSRPPINSLSCFGRNESQYGEMKANFLNKYIADPKTFRDFIDKL